MSLLLFSVRLTRLCRKRLTRLCRETYGKDMQRHSSSKQTSLNTHAQETHKETGNRDVQKDSCAKKTCFKTHTKETFVITHVKETFLYYKRDPQQKHAQRKHQRNLDRLQKRPTKETCGEEAAWKSVTLLGNAD